MIIHDSPYPMHLEWQPDQELVEQIAMRIGLIDKTFDEESLGEFVMYWVGQHMRRHSTYQWTYKFVQNLKFKRTAFRTGEKRVVGSQLVPNTAELTTDSNTKSLVEKYGRNG